MSVVDRDSGDIDDLIDYFSIPIDISAGSSLTSNFTGIYNYTQLELTIEVTCTQSNTDESCVCLSGFTGPLCEPDIIDCTAGAAMMCKNGGICVAGFCSCSPGYTGATCELGKKHTVYGNYYVIMIILLCQLLCTNRKGLMLLVYTHKTSSGITMARKPTIKT